MYSSLSREVSWEQLLVLVGQPAEHSPLPAIVCCPCCTQRQLHLYVDTAYGGTWYSCPSCQSAGDMIELAAKAWKCDLFEAILRLRSNQLLAHPSTAEQSDDAYVNQTVRNRTRARQFWTACQDRFFEATTPGLRQLQTRLGVNLGPADWWTTHGRDFVGAADGQTASLYLSEPDLPPGELLPKGRFSKPFRYPGWADLLVFPHSDLPGRICGFTFAGRRLDPSQSDLVYRDVVKVMTKPTTREAGLVMLETLLSSNYPQLEDTFFVFDNPVLAARLQLQWLRESGNPLPIAATSPSERTESRAVWSWLPRGRAVHVASTLRRRLLLEAQSSHGFVTTAREPEQLSPLLFLKGLRRAARHWELPFRDQLRELPPAEIESLFREFEFTDHRLADFLQRCDDALRERILAATDHPHRTRRLRYGTAELYEQNNCWYYGDKRTLVCNAVIRVEQIVHTQRGSFYRGRLLFQGQSFPFTQPTHKLDHDLFGWAATHLRDVVKAGVLLYYTPPQLKAIQIALQFHPPEIVEGSDIGGWDPDRRQFSFPHMTIQDDGSVAPGEPLIDAKGPGQRFKATWPISRQTVAEFGGEAFHVRLFWSLFLAVAREALAPVFHLPRRPIVFSSPANSCYAKRIAPLLGCTACASQQNELHNAHRWPLYLDSLTESRERTRRLIRKRLAKHGDLTGFLMPVPCRFGPLTAYLRQATLVQYEQRVQLPNWPEDTCQLLPDYLQSLLKRRKQLPPAATFEQSLVEDVEAWFRELSGVPRSCRGIRCGAAHLHWSPIDLNWAFRYTLDSICGPYPRCDVDALLTELPKHEPPAHAIRQQLVLEELQRKTGVLLAPETVTTALAQSSNLLGKETLDNDLCWLVPTTWWNSRKELT